MRVASRRAALVVMPGEGQGMSIIREGWATITDGRGTPKRWLGGLVEGLLLRFVAREHVGGHISYSLMSHKQTVTPNHIRIACNHQRLDTAVSACELCRQAEMNTTP